MTTLLDEKDFFVEVNGTLQTRYPDRPGFKQTAPETSRAAACSLVRRDIQQVHKKIIAKLRLRSYTADELAAELGESILYLRPRCSELKALARIEDSGIRRINQSGKRAVVWRVC